MEDDNKRLVRRFFEESDRTGAAPQDMLAPSFRAQIAGLPEMNADDLVRFTRMFYESFSDYERAFGQLVAEGDRVAFQSTLQATQTGEFMGIPASGTRVSLSTIGMVRIESEKIAEFWNSPDNLGMLRQLGALPEAPSPSMGR